VHENMKKLPQQKRNDIVSLLKSGKSVKDVTKSHKVSKSTVSKLRNESGITKKKKFGRKKLLSKRDEEFCKNKIVTGQMQHATDVKKALEKNFGINVSTNTVKRSLHRSGLKVGKKKKKPALSPKNRKMRLEFAKQHQQWTVEDWKRVVFSDETKINRFNSDGMNWCWFRDTKNLESRTVSQIQKFGGGSVLVWSCFSCEGIGFLCKIDGIMDSNLFLQILQGELKDSIKYFKFREEECIFQQDNDPKHKSKLVQEWLKKQKFSVLDWPAQSPDLNPIENLWAILKRKLNQYSEPPKGIHQLWERIEETWNKIEIETCKKLIESMPNRMASVVKAKGGWINY